MLQSAAVHGGLVAGVPPGGANEQLLTDAAVFLVSCATG